MQSTKENQYIQILSQLKEHELLPEATLKELLKNPLDLIVMNKLGNPERSDLADKMVTQLQNLQQQSPITLDNAQYLVILTANLTVYAYYEEDDKEAYYWEEMEKCYQAMESNPVSATLNEQQKALYRLVMATTYQIIKYPTAAIQAFYDAISFFKKDITKNLKYIRDCFLHIIELHTDLANKYYVDEAGPEAIQDEYQKAIKVANEALEMLAQRNVALGKVYYYKGQTSYFLAKFLTNQKINKVNIRECIKLLNSAAAAFLTAFMTTKSKDSQKKLCQRLQECYELFKTLESKFSKENIPTLQSMKYDYVQLNRFQEEMGQNIQSNKQPLFNQEIIKKMTLSFEDIPLFSLNNLASQEQRKAESYKEASRKQTVRH